MFEQSVTSDSDNELDLDQGQPVHTAKHHIKAENSTPQRLYLLNRLIDEHASEAPEVSSSPLSRARSVTDSEPPPKRVRLTPDQTSLASTDDDGDSVYKKPKARRSNAQKKPVRSSPTPKNAVKARTKPSAFHRRELRASPKRHREKQYGDLSNSDEELMEWTTPDYVQERRAAFDARAEKLKAGGLQLPPTWEDVEFTDDERLENLTEKPDFGHIKPVAPYKDIHLPYSLGLIPAPIAQWLRDYQVKGVAFLHELFVYQKGGILGDDMGLGKTVQVIAALTAAYGKTADERDDKRMRKARRVKGKWYPCTLIICPSSLMENWQSELDRWGWWHHDRYHGAKDRDAVLAAAQSGRVEIVVTTYTSYLKHHEAINMVAWDCVIADECHLIKNRKSQIAIAMNDLNALCRIGLTGTAIQNKYEELWTLLNWTNPGRLGPIKTWETSICVPLKLGQSHDASIYQLALARKTARKLVENLLPQFFLRRMKTLIKDQLPMKTDRVVFCPMTDTQIEAYENFLDSDIVQKIKYSSDPCDCGSGKKRGWCCHMLLEGSDIKWQSAVFPAIATLQKLSNHLALLIPQGDDQEDKRARQLEMLQIAMRKSWRQLYAERDHIKHKANPEFCGKWRVLKKLMQFWHGQQDANNKVLVFSHSVRLLKMLQSLFVHTEYNVQYLDGSMTLDDRSKAVRDFNTDPNQFVFLISTKAGGIGLNITSANKVVVVDPNWNPSYDLQAQDRAYRIGQTRDVEVFRLVSQGTLEEIVYARQIYKQQQASIGYSATSERRYFQGVQDRKDQKGELFGLNNLFKGPSERLDAGGGVLKEIVNKTNVAESKADVRVVGFEVEEDERPAEGEAEDHIMIKKEDDEEAAMSQLAAEIIGEDEKPKRGKAKMQAVTKKHDPVSAILASVGVQYTHENSEVVGSSKIEAHLSKQAEEATEAGGAIEHDAKVFFEESQSQAKINNIAGINVNGGIRYKYRPPLDVQRRQFCSMAKSAGYDDVVEFALIVESWTQNERGEWLSKFYRDRRDLLIGDTKPEAGDEVMSDVKAEVKEERLACEFEMEQVEDAQSISDDEDDEL